MIQIRRSEDRGFADHGWLQARHTFSFANFRDPAFMGFSVLRVLNQDRVQPAQGFGTHGHDNMEIVTYVIEGAVEHKDSMGNGSQIRPGEVQLMSAGTGVTHSEFNPSDSDELHLLQMWVLPAQRDTVPRYEQAEFPSSERRGRLRLAVAPDGRDGALTIGQDVELYLGSFAGGEEASHEFLPGRAAWLHVARGTLRLGNEVLQGGDGAAMRQETRIEIAGLEDAEIVLWDLPDDES